MPTRRKVRSGGASGGLGRAQRETPKGSTAIQPGGVTAVADKDSNALSGQAAHDYMIGLSQQWGESLSAAEVTAVQTWVGDMSSYIPGGSYVYNYLTGQKMEATGTTTWKNVEWNKVNAKLWTGTALNADESAMFKTLQSALAKAPTIDKPIILNKGISISKDAFDKQMVVGQSNVQLGVTNFATKFEGAYGGGSESIKMKVYVPAGAKMAYISKVASNSGETEVLTQSLQRIRVDSIEKSSSGGYKATGTFIPGIV